MATRLIGTDSADPKLPDAVTTATIPHMAATDAEMRLGTGVTSLVTPANARVIASTPIYDTYTGKGTVALGTADSGQTWNKTGTPVSPSIISGKAGVAQGTAVAGYWDIGLAGQVTRIGARWTYSTAGSTDDGYAVLVAWATSIVTGPTPPDSPFHFVISPTLAQLTFWESQVTTAGIFTYNFPVRLATDGTTVHECEAVFDGDTVTIRLPDGTIHTVTDSRIASINGDFAGWEVFQQTTSYAPQFIDVWADDRPQGATATVPTVALMKAIEATPARTALWLPAGTFGNNVTTPDAAAHDIVGDLCVVAHVAADDWTPTLDSIIAAKMQTAGQYSWAFYMSAAGALILAISTDGTAITYRTSSVNLSAIPVKSDIWVGFAYDVNNGSGSNDTRFWTSPDGQNWTQFGTTRNAAGTTATFSGTSHVMIGDWIAGGGFIFGGKIFEVSIRTGIGTGGTIGGTEVAHYDASVPAARHRDRHGNVWTVNGTGWAWMAA